MKIDAGDRLYFKSEFSTSNEKTWPEMIRAIAFYSLLEQQTENSWSAAILVARLPSSAPIDLSLLPDQTDRKAALHLWKDACRTTSGTKAEMYEVIRETVLAVGVDSIYGDLQLELEKSYLKCCRVAAYRGHISLRDRTKSLDVPHETSEAEYMADNSFPTSPLYSALHTCQVDQFVWLVLLQWRLPCRLNLTGIRVLNRDRGGISGIFSEARVGQNARPSSEFGSNMRGCTTLFSGVPTTTKSTSARATDLPSDQLIYSRRFIDDYGAQALLKS